MTLLGEIRVRARLIVGPVLAATVFAYFAYHAVQGDRGLIAWIKLNQQVQEARIERDRIASRRGALAARVHYLQPATLDRDLLEERTRAVLGYLHNHDMVIGKGRRIAFEPISAPPPALPPVSGLAVRISLHQ
jgi:cell division protein FtsB